MSDLETPEGIYILAARERARHIGNRSSEEQIIKVSQRPAFRASHDLAYRHGWMSALIEMEERKWKNR